ncbi:MAG: HEPN domain-containing protein [Anaerolinea sp.]|nr:HEPN domain-containing protein [Anaerolinea sp.]
MNEQAQRWFEQAQHDLDAASKNYVIELYDVTLILCQQALEKGLKALYTAQTGQFPPRIHSIERLADLTQMRSRLEQALLDLEDYYIRLRYPDFTGPLPYEMAEASDAEQSLLLTANALSVIEEEIRSPSETDSVEVDAKDADDESTD